MISKFLRLSFIVLAIVAIASCNSNDDDGPAEAPQVKFSAQVAGSPFRTDNATGVLSNDGKTLVITGTNDVGESISLRVGNFTNESPTIATGTYEINEDNLAAITYSSGGQTLSTDVDAGGFITISNFDESENTVFGSFVGTVQSSEAGQVQITVGSLFNITYTE